MVTNIFQTKKTNSILHNALERLKNFPIQYINCEIKPILITMWSDDFDPNKSIKSNRNSVWIRTITINVLDDDRVIKSETFVISLGKKGINHDEVNIEIEKELKMLRSNHFQYIFSGHDKSMINIHAELYFIMNDQPEKRSCTFLSAGNSTHHTRFMYSSNIKLTKNHFIACETCKNNIHILNQLSNIYILDKNIISHLSYKNILNCNKCSCWMLKNSIDTSISYEADKNFPLDKLDNNSNNTINSKLSIFTEL